MKIKFMILIICFITLNLSNSIFPNDNNELPQEINKFHEYKTIVWEGTKGLAGLYATLK